MEKKAIKILAIDDNKDDLDLFKVLLEDLFPEAVFVSAGTGKKGYELCHTENPDIILLDIIMPGMDGYEVCTRLKSDLRLNHIPVILITADRADKESRAKALEAGADSFLSKPVDETELKAQINAMLRIKKSEDQKIEEKQHLENLVLDRTEALELELTDRKRAEKKLILSLDKLTRNRQAILNLMEDLKSEMSERKKIEKNLQEERNLLRTLIDNIPDTIYFLDKECRKVIANKADVAIIGCESEAEVLGKTDIELFPGESGKRFHAKNLSVISSGNSELDMEEKFIDKNGEIHWLQSSYYPLKGTDGQISGLVGIGHNITERKRAEEILANRNNELQFLNKLATDLTSLEADENMVAFLMKRLKEFSGSEFVIYSEFEQESGTLITRQVEADHKFLNKLIKIAGDKIVDNPAPIKMTEKNFNEIITEVVTEKKSLGEISFGAIPRFIDKAFSSITGFTRYFGLSYVVSGELYGTSLMGFKQDQVTPSVELLKSFAHITAVSLRRRKVELELKKSEERYRMLIENQGEGVGIVDLTEKFVFVNPAAEKMFGVEPGDLVNRNLLDFISTDQVPTVIKETEKRSKAEKSSYEVDINKLDGTKCTILITATPQFDSDSKLTGTFGVFRDITERKKAETALKESEFFFKESQRAAFVGSYKADFVTGFWESSEVLDNIFGIEKSSDRSIQGWFNLIHPDDREMMNKHLNQDVLAEHKPFNKEYRIIRKSDNEIRWVAGLGQVGFDSKGTVISLTGTIQDVTERKRMEEKIIESEAYYRTLIDVSPDGILTSDMEGNVTYTSIKALEIFGIPPGVVVTGTSILNWVSPDFTHLVMERVTEILSGNTAPESREYKLLKYDRSVFWGELSSSPLTDKNGNPTGLLVVCRDITNRKMAEGDLIKARDKAQESDRLKTAFLHNISHEIRTPMNAIIGFSALLNEPDLDTESQHTYLEIITQSSNHLLGIVSDIIEISNIEAGLIKINKKEINLNSALKNLFMPFSTKASEKGIEFKYENGLPANLSIIQTDSDKLIQVISNILSNAFKFTSKGKIDFGYHLKDGFLEFSISDTGIGIPAEQHERIFERFYQVESTIARQYEGTGLGLPISKAYIELMDGKIWLKSEPGKGSIFCFSIPYVQTGKTESSLNPIFVSSKKIKNSKKTVLVAEDEENNYRLMVELLSSLNIELLHAINGKEAVDICRSGKEINLVLMDIKMPVMDGYTATREIRKIFPDLPVLALTAYAFESDREKAISCGCNEYLSKPIRKALLIETMNKYL